ncbi:hypothetical protein REPUB_Repub05bG0141500 [Reevesia pubescens]
MSSQPDSSSTPISSFNITTSQSQQEPNLITSRPRPLHPNNNSRSYLFVRRLILAIVLLFVMINVVNFIAWRILHPLPPVFEVNSFNISISPPNSPPSTDYNITFTIRNPNKKLSLLLDHFEVPASPGKTKLLGESVHLNKNPRNFSVCGRVLKRVTFLGEVIKVNFSTRFLAWNWYPKRESMVVKCSVTAKKKEDFTGEIRKGDCCSVSCCLD